MNRLALFAFIAALPLGGCDRLAKAEAEAKPVASQGAAKPKPKPKAGAKPGSKVHAKAAKAELATGPRRYVVPFAWEASRDEPLSQARAFVKEILTDNQVYMEHGPRFFEAFANGQKPRATVVTCADSRVHTPAFDTTPENDDFMIRNIGNQIGNAEGSVEYGVEHLETPVLLVLGHTGCGAVKAAMGDTSGLSEAVRREVEKLQVAKHKSGPPTDASITAGVIANVKNQVSEALVQFGSRVQEGKLTVVGAVYDFRNDLGNGHGKLTIIDVNGNSEPQRMASFVAAIEEEGAAAPGTAKTRKDPAKKGSHKLGPSDEQVVSALAEIPGLLVQQPKAQEATASAQARASSH